MVSLVRCATLLLLLAVAAPTWGGERAAYRGLEGTVVRVVDGDTIHVRVVTRVEKVRYIGVNAPEVHHPTKGVEPRGREAAAVNRRLAQDQAVRVELDVQERDRYRRLRRILLVAGVMINCEL